ncbi:exonuclease SbcC [Rhodobacteraceae bacterium RKSG542]|uniref:AAA family ATPase n=1 Tax=Pseudovibrio flavus TaxID=2529854 RepID=UPI0012BB806D|nr:exonuclease SbcC [Pseudovibrio flavus]
MRILSIRGENLASLAAPFEIDLEVQPLKGAGLFAITGETGAGKSTLLDAMCLALFGKCPRLTADGSNESVPDISGDTHGERDPKSVLTRGAASGFAEVDFLGIDGEVYRSQWVVRRARGKATGRLQNVDRQLVRVRDDKTIENGIKKVDAAVEEKLGLTYEQFRRTVLLAQGDFDAFLRAGDRERAALLEKVTGTDIYRRVSKRIHEQTSTAQQAVSELEKRCDAVGMLDDEQRGELQKELDEQRAFAAARQKALAELKAGAEILKRIDIAREQVEEAETKQDLAVRESEANETKRKLREQLKRIQGTEPIAVAQEHAVRQEGEARSQLQKLEMFLARADAIVRSSREENDKAQSVLEQIDADFAIMQPQWAEAERLDEAVRQLGNQVEGHRRETRSLSDQLSAFQQELTSKLREMEEQKDLKDKLKDQLARLKPAQGFHERGDDIITRINGAQDAAIRLSKIEDEEQIVFKRANELQDLQEKLEGRLQSFASQQQTIRARLNEAQNALGDFDIQTLQARRETLERLGGLVSSLERDSRFLGQNEKRLLGENEAVQHLTGTIEALTAQKEALSLELESLREQEERAEGKASLANKAADEVSAHLRMALVEDEPCPVCGSIDHPFVGEQAPAITALFEELRAEFVALREKRKTTEKQQQELGSAIAKAEAEKDQRQRSSEEISNSLAESIPAFEEQVGEFVSLVQSVGGSIDKQSIRGLDENWLSLKEMITGEAAKGRERLDAYQRLKAQVDADYGELQKLQDEAQKEEQQRDEQRRTIGSLEQQKVKLSSDKTNTQNELNRLGRELSHPLAFMETSFDEMLQKPESIKQKVGSLAAEWEDANKASTVCDQRLAELAEHIAGLRSSCESAERSAAEGQSKLKLLEERLQQERAKRAGLLNGKPTKQHQDEFSEKRAGARAAAQQTNTVLVGKLEELKDAQGRFETTKENLAAYEKTVTEAKAAFEAVLQELGVSAEEYQSARQRLVTELPVLEAELARIDEALIQTREVVRLRKVDLEKALAQPMPADPLLILEQKIEEAQNEHQDLLVKVGRVEAQLVADDTARAKAAGLMVEINKAKEHFTAWGAVNRAVGSAEGDKFQKIAQAVTLDLLVELANKQLQVLKPRYRLQRASGGLGILVEDRDMGDVPRSTRSLSGGERFLVSLSLALALSGLEGRQSFVDTLFIDEGFGSLDGDTLDVAIDALEMLQGQGRKVGVISHVEAMKDRIPVQIRVERQGAGKSRVALSAPELW